VCATECRKAKPSLKGHDDRLAHETRAYDWATYSEDVPTKFWGDGSGAIPSEKVQGECGFHHPCLASVSVSVFLRGSASRAQATALSCDSSPAISLTRRSRSTADCSAGRTVEFAGLAAPVILPLADIFGWTWTPATEGSSRVAAQRSRASSRRVTPLKIQRKYSGPLLPTMDPYVRSTNNRTVMAMQS
jgi:hypothetical protein